MDYTELISDAVDWIIATVFKNIVLFACPVITYMLLVRYFNDRTQEGPQYYSTPGRAFYIKKVWAYICLHKMRWGKKKEFLNKNYAYGLLPTPEEVKTEEPLNLNGKHGTECNFIFGVDNKRNLLILRISTERVEHRLHPEVWIHACIGGEIYQLPMHPDSGLPNSGPISFPPPSPIGKSYTHIAGLKFEICEPMRKWRIHFNGLLRKGCHKEMTPFTSKDLVHVRFDFIWTACSSPFYVHQDYSLYLASEALAREPWRSGDWINAMRNEERGYDQWGTIFGEWKVGDLASSPSILHLRGVRRRRWGPYDSGDDSAIRLRHKAEFLGVSTQGSFFSIGASSMDNGGLTHTRFGHIRDPAGISSPITSSDISLPHLSHYGHVPDNSVIRFSANGKNYTASIRLLRFGDVILYTGRPWKYKTWLALIDFGLNLDGGVGISEFVYRYDGPCPISTPGSLHISRHFFKHLGDIMTEEEREQLEESKPLVLQFSDHLCQNSKLVGGKGSSLAAMACVPGDPFKVPSGFCLTTFAFQEQVNSSEILRNVIAGVKDAALKEKELEELQECCIRTVNAIKASLICPAVAEAVKKGLDTLKKEGKVGDFGFAIRSSAVGEDSKELSAAGQNATVLGCNGYKDILNAIKACWGSLYAYQSVLYRRQHGQISTGSEIAVVIQCMIPAEAAGVMFTRHPYTGNPSQIVITANYGLGESVVAAIAEPDTFTLHRDWDDTLSLQESKTGEKSLQVSIDVTSWSTKENPVDDNLSNKLCLSIDEALSLGRLGVQLEEMFCTPRDIEWAIVKDKIYILQARPITALDSWTEFGLLHELDSPVITDTEVTTLANTGEVLPGAMTPLTSSVMAKALDVIIQQGPDRTKQSIPHFLRNAVITHHQLAMNVINTFFRINEPQITLSNKVVHLAVFGSPCINPELHRLGIERHGLMKTSQTVCLTVKLVLRSFGADCVMKRVVSKSKSIDLHPQKFKTAKDLYKEISTNQYILLDAALDHNFASTIGVFSQIILVNTLSEGQKDLKPQHYADISLLLSSCTNVVSAEIPNDLQELASRISKSDGADEFCTSSSTEAVSWFGRHPGEAARFFEQFLHKHGHRCLREFDLQSHTWGMKPDCLMSTLQTMVRAAGVGQERNQAAFEGVERTIEKLQTPIRARTKYFIKKLLPWCRKSVARREETKSALVRTLHAFRVAYRHLGYLAQLEGIIPDEDLIFYFTHYELNVLLNSEAASKTALIVKAWRRRKLRPKWDKLQLPETFFGIAIAKEFLRPFTDGSISVTGISASLGVVTGRACVIKSVEEAHDMCPEDILITKCTDVGWAPYFPFLSGIVTEMGGLISHGAVVAREYGLPCIVGATSATHIFKTGDTVLLNASTGVLSKVVDE